MPARKTEPLKRFLKYINVVPSGCWEWVGSLNPNGYGVFGDGEKATSAHRFSYEYYKGKIPAGYQVDHLCHNRKCVNPDHLEVVTFTENQRRRRGGQGRGAQQRAKTHCPKGHPYDEENTYYYRNARGNIARNCKTCMRLRDLTRETIKKEVR